MHNQTVRHYLTHYAEPLAARYADNIEKTYQYALVVPIYDEPPNCLARLCEQLEAANLLVIGVVNAPINAPLNARHRTQRLLNTLGTSTPLDILVIDCVSQPLAEKAGVGLARKIGTDTALALHNSGKIISPWLYQSDADAQLPHNYLHEDHHQMTGTRGAVVFGHIHHSENVMLTRAARLYEQHMRYYVAGLASAHSPYAYPTLGSTIAVHATSYAAVRGYPQRNAAEDFYLLNKVAKVHGVAYKPDTVLTLQARTSHRVPFGTGPALEKIAAELTIDGSGKTYLSYHPESFALLATTLNYLGHLADGHNPAHFPTDNPEVIGQIEALLNAIGF